MFDLPILVVSLSCNLTIVVENGIPANTSKITYEKIWQQFTFLQSFLLNFWFFSVKWENRKSEDGSNGFLRSKPEVAMWEERISSQTGNSKVRGKNFLPLCDFRSLLFHRKKCWFRAKPEITTWEERIYFHFVI